MSLHDQQSTERNDTLSGCHVADALVVGGAQGKYLKEVFFTVNDYGYGSAIV